MPLPQFFDDNEYPLLQHSVVAVFLGLGFHDRVAESVTEDLAPELFEDYHTALTQAMCGLDDFDREGGFHLWAHHDAIGICAPLPGTDHFDFSTVVDGLNRFQLTMTNHGFFLQGGVTLGDVFVDKNIAYGAAWEEARALATSTPSRANAVLSESIARLADGALSGVTRDENGRSFLDYLDAVLYAADDIGPLFSDLDDHKDRVAQALARNTDTPATFAMFKWVADYHNTFCDDHSWFNRSHKVKC